MFAWYKMLLLRHLFCRGYCDILMQLQVLPIVGDGYSIFLLCAFSVDFIFGRQLQLSFTLFRLNNLCNLWCGGKCLSIKLKKNFPTFVITFLLYVGLNQMICHLRYCELSFFWSCFWYVNLWLYPALISASWYMGIESLKIFSLKDNLLKRLLTNKGNCLMMEGGWFDWFMYIVYFIVCFTEWSIRRICKVKSYI